jgi:sarcosine oxidase, subunit alpha
MRAETDSGATAPKTVPFRFAGQAFEGRPGDTLAAALWRAGVRGVRRSPHLGEARGMWCGSGHCYECRVVVNGVHGVRACLLALRPGLEAESETPPGEPS